MAIVNLWIPKAKLPRDGQKVTLKGIPSGQRKEVLLDTIYHDSVGFISNVTHWRAR